MHPNRLRLFASRRFVIPFVVAVFIAMALIGTATLAFGKAHNYASNFLGPPLSAAQRTEIDHANCGQLQRLYFAYAPNADSVRDASEAWGRILQRRERLHCTWKP